MTTASDVLTEARAWLGTREQPAGSNNVPGITDWYGLKGAWCAMFVSRVFYNAGMPLGPGKGFAWVSGLFDWAKGQPGWTVFTDWRQAAPGDICGWEWGTTPGGLDHVSLVEAQGPFVTIGGNERDQVKREFWQAPGGAVIFARPPYAPETISRPSTAPGAATPRRDTMPSPLYTVRNADGLAITFMVADGRLVDSWIGPDGKRTKWAQPVEGLEVVALGEPLAAGPVIWVPVVANTAFGQLPVTLVQRSPGGLFEVIPTDELGKALAGLAPSA